MKVKVWQVWLVGTMALVLTSFAYFAMGQFDRAMWALGLAVADLGAFAYVYGRDGR